jgi:hypothetical protein
MCLYCRVGTESNNNNISSLPGGSMKFIWWKLKMSYHTAYPSWDCPAIVCHLFLYSFTCAPTTAFSLDCQNFVHYNSLVFFLRILEPLLVQGFISERGRTIFKIVYIGVSTLKCTEECFIPFSPLHFLP